jgi:hypothetical protein
MLAIFTGVIVLMNDFGGDSKFSVFTRIFASFFRNTPTYFILFIPYLLFTLIRSIVRDYKKQQFKDLLKGIGFKIAFPAIIIWGSIASINEYRQNEDYTYLWDYSIENNTESIRNLYVKDKKQRGFHIFGRTDYPTSFEALKTNNVEWLTHVPFLSQEIYNTPSLEKSNDRDSLRRFERWEKILKQSEVYGFNIMLKPHVWLSNTDNGVWRSDISMQSQDQWDIWFKAYSAHILYYARLAELHNIKLFCIGTELHTAVLEQPEHWTRLIAQVRSIYSGKLTYAANWNQEVNDIPFWDALDFIGIQAYYPIAENENPELAELENGWKQHIDVLEAIHLKYNKPILFTELGYKSTTDAGIKPWEWNTLGNRFHKKISKRTQALCYQAFFNTVWQKEWLEGVHLWEWQSRVTETDGNNNSFLVQGKPALNVIAKEFKKPMD